MAPATRRDLPLYHAHHQEVARFEEAWKQAEWLDKALAKQWTAKPLREAIQQAEGEDESGRKRPGRKPVAFEARAENAGQIITRVVLAALTAWWEEKWAAGTMMSTLAQPETREASSLRLAESIAEPATEEGVK